MALKSGANGHALNGLEMSFLLAISIYALLAAFYANGSFIVEDAAIHSEMANIIKNNPYPQTYGPVANVPYTYPPAFHYLAALLAFFGIGSLEAVKLLGALSFAFFPIAIYFLGSLFGKRAGLFSALATLISENIFMALIFSEYPEILSFVFFALFLYSYFSDRHVLSGIFLGLTVLTHPFTAIFAIVCASFLFALKRDRKTAKMLFIGLVITLFWLPKYFQIFANIFSGAWNNVRWYSANGFIGIESILNTVLRLNPFVFVLSLIGIIFIAASGKYSGIKKRFFLFLYLFPLAFVIYHCSPAQYKFLDIFAIPVSIFFGIGIDYSLNKSGGLGLKTTAFALITVLSISSLYFPVMKIQEYESKFSAISPETENAAKWLYAYDSDQSRLLVLVNSSAAHKETLVFESELVFSQIANKIPLDGTISDLESYTPEYRKQLKDREEMIKGNLSLARNYGVKYVVSDAGRCPFEKIYGQNGIEICRVRS